MAPYSLLSTLLLRVPAKSIALYRDKGANGIVKGWSVSRFSYRRTVLLSSQDLQYYWLGGAQKNYYQNANKITISNSEFSWRLLAKYANENNPSKYE
jgi:hypothetical protein